MRRFIKIILILPLILLCTCEDKNENYFDVLFEATFNNNFAADGVESFLVIQDTLGNVLADTSWSGDTHFNLYSSKSGAVPEYISVTYITKEDNGKAKINTYYKIPSQSHWIWDDIRFNNTGVGNISLSFINIPNHNDVSLSTEGTNNRYLQQIEDGQTYSLSTLSEESDILIMLKTDNGALYKWVTNIMVGSNIEVDLSSCQIANVATIPTTSYCAYTDDLLFGYVNHTTNYFTKKYLLITNSFNRTQDDIKLYYPNNISSFNTEISCYESEYQNGPVWFNAYHQLTFGEIPQEFVKTDASAEIMNSDIDDLVIYRNGSFDQYELYFKDQIGNYWTMSVNPKIGSTKLPQLPTSVYDAFTELDRSNFRLKQLNVWDFVGIESHEELLDILFKTDNIYIYDIISTTYIRMVPISN